MTKNQNLVLGALCLVLSAACSDGTNAREDATPDRAVSALAFAKGEASHGKNDDDDCDDDRACHEHDEHSKSGCVAEVSAGSRHTCAITRDGRLWCWGANEFGQLGNGQSSNTPATTAVQVTALGHAVVHVAAGLNHTCAILADSTLWCWGNGTEGELGNGQQGLGTRSLVPLQVTPLGASVASVSVGDELSCALTLAGAVFCWGANFIGQVGTGVFNDQPGDPIGIAVPTQVVGLGSGVTQLAVGSFHSCVIKLGGGVSCWGADGVGELGDGNVNSRSAVPIGVSTMASGAQQLTAGADHTCAVKTDGSLWCWGDNTQGDLGDGNDTITPVPVLITGLAHVSAVDAGFAHTCAISHGALFCWGDGQDSTIFNGLTGFPAFSFTPVRIKRAGCTAAVSVGLAHTCAVRTSGELICWGANQFGELGVGDTTDRAKPTLVHVPCH
jgi:alpha-tubulin suppressor-like RCC1 family protein